MLPLLLERLWRLRADWGTVRCDGTRAGESASLSECRRLLSTPVTMWEAWLWAALGSARCGGTRVGSYSNLVWLPAPVVALELFQRGSEVWFEHCLECVLLEIRTYGLLLPWPVPVRRAFRGDRAQAGRTTWQ